MINPRDNPVAWALLCSELDEAYEHLGDTIKRLSSDPGYGGEDFAVDMGHIAAHLNRSWARRNLDRDLTDEEFEAFRDFPRDLTPIA